MRGRGLTPNEGLSLVSTVSFAGSLIFMAFLPDKVLVLLLFW